MRLIMPRAPDNPIPLEEWKQLRETVGECQRDMEALLELVEAGTLDALLTLLRELTETIEQITKQGPPSFMTTMGRPVKKEEEEPSEQPQ